MSPVRQSARQRARSATQGRPPRMLDDEVTASPLIPTPRFTTAAATGVAQRQLLRLTPPSLQCVRCSNPCVLVLTFKAYLTVGEMVPPTNGMTQNWLQFDDVTMHDTMITVSFRHLKHSGRRGPQSLQFHGA